MAGSGVVEPPWWTLARGPGPLVATAIHAGHGTRPEVAARMALDDADRRREEDPFTDRWVDVAPTRVVGCRSRFEVDLNRPRERAVYRAPEDAWGLEVWKEPPDDAFVERSLVAWDAFYDLLAALYGDLERRHGRFLVLDLHSYNHRREGPDRPADPRANPEVNVGTGPHPDDGRWRPLVERFITELGRQTVAGHALDVRENVKFRGGHHAAWTHERFPDSACVLAVEFKKTFMDEWTGEPFDEHVAAIGRALAAVVPAVLEEL